MNLVEKIMVGEETMGILVSPDGCGQVDVGKK